MRSGRRSLTRERIGHAAAYSPCVSPVAAPRSPVGRQRPGQPSRHSDRLRGEHGSARVPDHQSSRRDRSAPGHGPSYFSSWSTRATTVSAWSTERAQSSVLSRPLNRTPSASAIQCHAGKLPCTRRSLPAWGVPVSSATSSDRLILPAPQDRGMSGRARLAPD